ncbi:MAG: hypothetical protein E4H32_00710 [Nitrospirales bacterium]|nr:MAG: hypothetical protein E4H32_00710 [Nitrospirales bacterium]
MLHRLSLRVLPQLNLLVTDQPVRKRKRLVMLAPGLVAFGIYRLLKDVLPLSEPLVLLGLSGCVSALAAVWAYRQGRGISLQESFRQDGLRQWAWIVGWIGAAYGMQLSLLVLAILQVFVGYDFLIHPEGPAMMAMIIPCTSVTRDAFEIGVVQRLAREGTVVPTFPNGEALREWIPQQAAMVMKWGGMAIAGGILSSWMLFSLGSASWQPILQSALVPVLVASMSLLAFFAGEALYEQGTERRKPHTWLSCLWFWIWPSLTFALTYFLVLIGLASYVFRIEQISQAGFLAIAGSTGLVMTLYSLYLGWRKSYEERLVTIPENIQRCPFVMGMLQQSKAPESVPSLLPHGDLVK